MSGFESQEDIVASIKEQTDIVSIIGQHVDLKRSGVRFIGLCPFHGEKTPSFSVHSGQQFYYCFGCGESGDVYSFVMKYYGMEFPQALKFLADRLNIRLPEKNVSERAKRRESEKEKLFSVNRKAAAVYHRLLLDEALGEQGRKYLEQRGIPKEIQLHFGLGYAPAKERAGWEFFSSRLSVEEKKAAEQSGLLVKNDRGGHYDRFRDRLLFPISDNRGRICGFGGRIVGEGNPKYLNSPESPVFNKSNLLLGLYQQHEAIQKRRQVVVVEGNFDLISMVVHGIDNVVAPLGTALTAAQLRLLKRYADEVVLLFDGDAAGIKAALRAVPLFLAEDVKGRVALLPEGEDPDTFVRDKGGKELLQIIAEGLELPEFMLDRLIEEHGLGLDGKKKIADQLKELVAMTSSPLQRSVFISHFAEKLGIAPQQLEQLMQQGGTAIPVEKRKVRREEGDLPLSPAQKRLVEFMVLNPSCFAALDERGIRDILRGGVGEIVYLQVQAMVNKVAEVQPEEILTALPDGPERKLVSDMLLTAWETHGGTSNEDLLSHELKELCEWLELSRMRENSRSLDKKIAEAQRNGESEALDRFLREKQALEREMRRLREA